MRLQVEDLAYSYGEKDAVDQVSLQVERGEFVGLIGPNGSGKSTVLKNIYRGLTPDRGSIKLDGENLMTMPYKKSALKMAVVGHKKLFDVDNVHDKEIVHHALEHMGMAHMAKRSYLNLSGGEKQRVLIARAIAQESDFLILDEPTNHLDISYQIQIFDFIKRLNVTVLSAIHDLNLAALYCDRLYVLKNGKIVLQGTPEEVLTEEHIYEVYGVKSSVSIHPVTGKLAITYLPEALQNIA